MTEPSDSLANLKGESRDGKTIIESKCYILGSLSL